LEILAKFPGIFVNQPSELSARQLTDLAGRVQNRQD